jgi:acyl-CoA thioesterase-1
MEAPEIMRARCFTRTPGQRTLLAAVGVALLLASAETAAQESGKACNVLPETFGNAAQLERTRGKLVAGKPVTIVAIGGASTLGRAAGAVEHAWPARLAHALSDRFPGARVQVVNRGVPRETAFDMLNRFQRDVLGTRPTLVIWETGTTEAVRGDDVDAFRLTLQTGIQRIRDAGAEIVLMDMQFSRRAAAMINLDRYRTALREVSDAADVPVFPRYDVMRTWVEAGLFDFSVTEGEKSQAMAVQLYDCLGRAVAQFVARGAGDGRR